MSDSAIQPTACNSLQTKRGANYCAPLDCKQPYDQTQYSDKALKKGLPADKFGMAACVLSGATLLPCCFGVLILYLLVIETASSERAGTLLFIISLLSGAGLKTLFYIFIPVSAAVVGLCGAGLARRRRYRSCAFSIAGLIFAVTYIASFIVLQTVVI